VKIMHIFHCWHKVDGSERKIPYKTKCKLQKSQFVHDGHIDYTIQYKCCVCGKVKESSIYRDYNISRAEEYKIKGVD
jgi:hypothetical protein